MALSIDIVGGVMINLIQESRFSFHPAHHVAWRKYSKPLAKAHKLPLQFKVGHHFYAKSSSFFVLRNDLLRWVQRFGFDIRGLLVIGQKCDHHRLVANITGNADDWGKVQVRIKVTEITRSTRQT